MSDGSLETLAWVCLFGGLLVVSLGLFVPAGEAALRWSLLGAGAAAVVAGVVLVWVRSRRR